MVMRLLTILTTHKNRFLSSQYLGYVVIIAAAALAALLHVVSKPLLGTAGINATEINPVTLAAIIYLINGLFFTPIKKDNGNTKFDKRNIFLLSIIGIAEVSAIITYFFGLKDSTAVNASILTNGEILFSILVAVTILKERIHKKEVPAFAMIIFGIILLPVGYDLYRNGMVLTQLVFGDLLILLSGIFVATDINLCRYVSDKIGPKKITQIVSFVGAGFAFSLMMIFQIPFEVDPQHIPSIAIIGLFGTGMSTFLFLIALKLIGTVRTVLLYSTSSVFGMIFAALLLKESITLPNVISIILVTFGLYVLRNRLGGEVKKTDYVSKKPDYHSFTKLCGSCTHIGCCTNFANPLVFSHDMADLEAIGKSGSEYIDEIKINGKNVKIIKKKNNSTVCAFFDEEKKRCTIYQNRPFDCRAYPFDIYLIDGEYHWIVYSCNPNSDWSWTEKHLEALENDVQFNEIMKDADVFSNLNQINTLDKSQKFEFTILREVKYEKSKSLKNTSN
jgi:drug/metabolite transporter (DMT)-like permease/Fe-S-cluster containining protein